MQKKKLTVETQGVLAKRPYYLCSSWNELAKTCTYVPANCSGHDWLQPVETGLSDKVRRHVGSQEKQMVKVPLLFCIVCVFIAALYLNNVLIAHSHKSNDFLKLISSFYLL